MRIAWGTLLLIWLSVLCIVPDPRPLAAPEWAVRSLVSAVDISEPSARAVATAGFRAVGAGLIGILLVLSLNRVRLRHVAPIALVAAPPLAVGAKWINFGYFPTSPQLRFIVVAAVLGALVGLVLRRSWIALVGLVSLSVGLFLWGTSTGISDELYAAARETANHILETTKEVQASDDSFARLLEAAFFYAEDNSHGTDPVLPNQAAILALGVILGDERVAWVGRREIDPKRGEERAALRRGVSIHGRSDLSQHFWASAALVILSDEQRALTVGITKEMKDSTRGGSGFSFVDMAANKAGIRFAAVATRNAASARRLQRRIVGGVTTGDFLPAITNLPEGISSNDFHSQYGGLGGAETQRLFDEIEQRLDALRGFQ